jgi:hypothetical protein
MNWVAVRWVHASSTFRTHPGAVVDGGELIQPSLRPGDSLQELHIELQPMTRLGLLIPLPSFAVRLMLLIRR